MREKEKLLVTSNFSFSHSVFKGLVLQTRKNQGLLGKGVMGNCPLSTECKKYNILISLPTYPRLKCWVGKGQTNDFLAWAWLAKPKAIVIVYQLFRPCHAFTEITEKKTRKSANHSLQSISMRFKKGPWKQKYIFS